MPECPSLPRCPFFNDHMATRPATADMMKKTYCRTDNAGCARWLVASTRGKEAVPADLFPNQVDRARVIVAKDA